MRTLSRLFDLLKAFVENHEYVLPILRHMCATCSKIPSNIGTMKTLLFPPESFQLFDEMTRYINKISPKLKMNIYPLKTTIFSIFLYRYKKSKIEVSVRGIFLR